MPKPKPRRSGLLINALNYLKVVEARKGTRNRMSGKSLNHQLRGDLKQRRSGRWKGTGYHHRPGGMDHPDRRVTMMSRKDPKTGVYEGYVEFKNPSPPPPWIPKSGNQGWSSFWPDHMEAWQVDKATSDAFKNAKKNEKDGTWEGMYGDIRVEGFYDTETGDVRHGWPKL